MKKIVSIVCALALMMTMSVTAFAVTPTINPDGQRVVNALNQVSYTYGGYKYTLPGDAIAAATSYLTAHNPTALQTSSLITSIGTVKSSVETEIQSGKYDFNGATTLLILNGMGSAAYVPVPVTFSIDGNTITATADTGETYTFSSVLTRTSTSSGSTTTPTTPTTPTEPAGNVDTTANPSGGTTVSVTPTPSAPVVSGSTSTIGISIPEAAASASVLAATAQQPAEVKVSAPAAALVSQLGSSAVTAVQMTVAIPAALAGNTNPNVNVSLNVDQTVMAAAQKAQKDISISVVDSATQAVVYSWTFNGKALAQSGAAAKAIDMGLSVRSSANDSSVSASVPAAKEGLVLHFGNNGDLPAAATVKVNVARQGYPVGQSLYLYYFNAATKQLETVGNSVCTVDAGGFVNFVINHCSQYVLLPQQASAVSPLKVDTGKYLNVKAGKTYQFKVTATKKPTFASGNSSVFKVVENGSKGNDYFFKVTAVGKVGQGVGFYVNGEKSPRTIGTIVK